MNLTLLSLQVTRFRQNSPVQAGLMALLLLLGSFSTQAQTTNTWTGDTDSDWNTTTNWSLTLVPTATHNVMIPASLTNYPILSGAASAHTVEVQSGASLTISSAGSLSVNGSKSGANGTARFRNQGTVVNAGQVFLGNSPTATAAQVGLRNAGTFTHTGGQITIDRVSLYGLLNTTAGGSFVNSGTLVMGAVSSPGLYGLANVDEATFSNTAGGYITLDRTTGRALWNSSASSSFVNSSTIVIGSIAEVDGQGLWNFGSFRNLANGFIAIDRTTNVGLSNSSTGTGFINSGAITIGSSATIGSNGLSNSGSFTNTAGGSITIDRTRFASLYNGVVSTGVSASFVNSATITFGTSLTSAIENDGMLDNQGGGCINPAPGLINSLGNGVIIAGVASSPKSFSNTGTIIENSTGNSGISFNGGVIQNLNGGSFTVASGSLTPTATLTVTSNADSGPNTLRQAMLDVMATTCPGPFTITVTASGTINLASEPPNISKDITFIGPGATNLTVRRSSASNFRLFTIPSTNTVRFDGFTLADGYASGSSPADQGGAIYHSGGSSLTVTNCVFNTNQASVAGGAIFSEGTQLVLSHCAFIGNTTSGYGGALECSSPDPVITNCFFTNNTASVGGAIDFSYSSPNITNCAFVGNSAGGGDGGAIATFGGTATVTNSSFRQNTGGTDPGQAQAIYNESSSFSLNNSILFDNGVGQPITNPGSSTVVARYSLFDPSVTDYTDGGNNLTTSLSPFASTTGVGLNACSPAIDAGDPASTTVANPPYSNTSLPALDVTGNARIVGVGLASQRVDMGAEEYAGPGSFTTTLTVGPSSTLTCSQTSLTLTATGGSSYTFTGPGLSQSGAMPTAVVSQSGTYSVTATDATGCTSMASTTVSSNTVTPTAGLVVSGTATCASSPTITLSGSETGVSYQLQRDGATTGSAVVGTGLALSFGPQSLTGTYTVLATSTSGCTAVMATSATVVSNTVAASVSVTPSSGTLSCASPTVSLSAIGTGNVLWSTGATSPVISATVAGTYSVTLTNASGCTATANATVTGTVLTSVAVTADGPIGCGRTTATITIQGSGASSYTLLGLASYSQVSSTGVFVVTAGGSYTGLASQSGCVVSGTVTVSEGGIQPTASNFRASGALGSGSCWVQLLATATGDRYTVTGTNGYVFSNVYRTVGSRELVGFMVTQPGTYTLTVYSGSCSASYNTVVSGTACP